MTDNTDTQINIPEYMTIVRCEEATDGIYCYVAFHPEFPNAMSQGDTSEEAEENLVEATELALAYLQENDLPVPKPMSWQDAFVVFMKQEGIVPYKVTLLSPYELTESQIQYSVNQYGGSWNLPNYTAGTF